MINELIDFINESPTAFNATKTCVSMLEENGYEKLLNNKIQKGGKYYITRNDSSVIAFNVGKSLKDPSLQIVASHGDMPALKLKPNPIHKTKNGVGLNIETYGGIMLRPWFDRPLSLAGRVVINDKDKIVSKNFIGDEAFCIIPNMAIHLNREIDNKPLNIPNDITPIVTLNEDFDFNDYLSKKLKIKKENILSFDLYLYPLQKAYTWSNNELISSNHLDNLESVFVSLIGFVNNFNDENINVFAMFDNEEVGSLSMMGADSDFLKMVLEKISTDLKIDYYSLLRQGMMVSFDAAQAYHPNHPELYDVENAPFINKGLAVKFNANQSYTSSSLSYAIFSKLLKDHNIPYQTYSNKTGLRGGSTLGKISSRHVSILSIDIGLPILSMHSSVETGGTKDIETSIDALSIFYKSHLKIDNENNYTIK